MKKAETFEAKCRVTGEGFRPGFDCDRRIADLLGIPVDEPVPGYCESPDLTRTLLETRTGAVWERQTPEGASVVMFGMLDALGIAMGACREHALASALLCSLEENPKMGEI